MYDDAIYVADLLRHDLASRGRASSRAAPVRVTAFGEDEDHGPAAILEIGYGFPSLSQVIWVQVVMVVFLLLCVAIPFVATWAKKHSDAEQCTLPEFIRLRRRTSEDEVIAEFLKNEVTSNLPFQEWTGVLGSERITGALLDRLTHHVHILEMNGESLPA